MNDPRGTADNRETSYRPDIDGLRAIAVLSVIAFHLSKKLLPGGYLGVDIFFVLSGYLITAVILREAVEGRFFISRFYDRRMRRIAPALVAVLIVVSICSFFLLLPIDLESYAKSAFASLGFVANVFFWRHTGYYFAQLADEQPLLHLWSLGIEEQFYIIFPAIVVLCVRWKRSALLPLTAIGVLVSLAGNSLANRMGAGDPAFYLLPTRAWELGAGAVLAQVRSRNVIRPWLRNILSLMAVILIGAGLFLSSASLGSTVPAPLWAVLGTVIAIYLGASPNSWLTVGLSWGPLVWLGLISYSLYLWHWPIIVFARYYLVVSTLSWFEASIAVALMITLAALSWRYVERPFRNRSFPIGKVLAWSAGGCMAVAGFSAVALAYKGFPNRFSPDIARINAAVDTEYRCALNEYIPFGASRGCLMGLAGRDPGEATVALVGNSHAQMYAPLVTDILRENHRGGILVPLNSCLPTPDYNESSQCMALAAQNLSSVEELPHVQVVILGMTWESRVPMYTPAGLVPSKDESRAQINSVDNLIGLLQERGKTVVLIGPISPPGWESASITGRQLAFRHKVSEQLFLPDSAFMSKQGEAIEHFTNRRDIIFIRPDLIQCQNGRCDYFRNGESLFADSSHLAEGALPLFRVPFEQGLARAFSQTRDTASR